MRFDACLNLMLVSSRFDACLNKSVLGSAHVLGSVVLSVRGVQVVLFACCSDG